MFDPEVTDLWTRRRGDAVMFGEVNLDPGQREQFFGDQGDEMTGLFDFILCGELFASLADGRATCLAEQLTKRPRPPRTSQWLTFLRNHDELNVSHVPEEDKQLVMDTGDERVLAHRCDWVCEPEELEQLTDEFGNEPFDPVDPQDPRFTLSPYGYRWLRARHAGSDLPI